MEEEQESGITFGELCRLIGKKIWLVLAVSAGVTVIAVLLVALVFNPMSTYYSMRFELIYPSGSVQQYPDGTPFFYRNIISADMLQAAKDSDERFKDVDIDKMLREDHISVSAQTETTSSSASSVIYTLGVKGNYFVNGEAAQLFIRSVAEATANDIKQRAAELSFGISRETFNGNNFEARLDLLAEEYRTLLAEYDKLIAAYSAGYSVNYAEGASRSLSDLRAEVYGLYADGVRKALTEECTRGGYGLLYGSDDEAVTQASIDERVAQLRQTYQDNLKIIASLQAAAGGSAATSVMRLSAAQTTGKSSNVVIDVDPTPEQLIAYYTEQNALIATKLGDAVEEKGTLNGTLTSENAKKFAAKLTASFDRLNGAAETLKNVTAAIYRDNTFVEFDAQSAESSGGTNIVLAAVGAFVLTFLVAAVIVCAREYAVRKRAEQAPPAEKPEG